MGVISELGYENAIRLTKNPTSRTMNDSYILNKYLILDVDMLKRYIKKYETDTQIVELELRKI